MNMAKLFKQKEARKYDDYIKSSQSLQKGNAYKLLGYISKFVVFKNVKVWLDVGCGTGLMGEILKTHLKDSFAIGIDLSKEFLSIAAQKNIYDKLICCDILDTKKIKGALKEFKVDLIVSNSCLHWTYSKINIAIKNCVDILAEKGFCAFSIAGTGTAPEFLNCYKKVVNKFLKAEEKKKYATFIVNPYGLLNPAQLNLDELPVKIIKIEKEDEDVKFKSAEDYINAAECFQKKYLLGIFPNKNKKEDVWKELTKLFLKKVGNHGYYHQQKMIYFVVQKQETKSKRP